MKKFWETGVLMRRGLRVSPAGGLRRRAPCDPLLKKKRFGKPRLCVPPTAPGVRPGGQEALDRWMLRFSVARRTAHFRGFFVAPSFADRIN
jgi:hypothetical protein